MEALVKLLDDPEYPQRSAKTVQGYANLLKTLHDHMQTSIPLEQPDRWLARFGAVQRILDSYDSVATRLSFLSAILVVSRDRAQRVYEHWQPLFVKLTTLRREREDQQERSDRDKENWVTLAEIRGHLKHLTKQLEEVYSTATPPGTLPHRRLMFNHLILALYTLQPACRNDWAELRVWNYGETIPTEQQECNRLVEEQPGSYVFHLHQYKTARKYGKQTFTLSRALSAIIKASLNFYPRTYLLSKIHKPQEAMSRNLLTKTFAQVLPGKRLGSSLMRKVTVTEAFADDAALLKRKQLAAAMMHSPITAQRNYEFKS